MPAAHSTVKSTARADRARALIATLPRDERGRILKRPAAEAIPPASAAQSLPAGGTAPAPPFLQAPRGLARFRRQRSGSPR